MEMWQWRCYIRCIQHIQNGCLQNDIVWHDCSVAFPSDTRLGGWNVMGYYHMWRGPFMFWYSARIIFISLVDTPKCTWLTNRRHMACDRILEWTRPYFVTMKTTFFNIFHYKSKMPPYHSLSMAICNPVLFGVATDVYYMGRKRQ